MASLESKQDWHQEQKAQAAGPAVSVVVQFELVKLLQPRPEEVQICWSHVHWPV